MSIAEASILILSGVLVGFINTLAGGGTIITISLLIFLGLPINIANGTNRVAVLLQTMVAVFSFKKQQLLDTRRGMILCIPSVIGSLAGSFAAVKLHAGILEKTIAIAMLILLFFIVFKPEKWLEGGRKKFSDQTKFAEHLAFAVIGFYGGFIHIGVGFFMITALVLLSGYDLLKANAVKNLMVLAYTPFTLIVFVYYEQVNWKYGLILSIGNVIGAYLASRFAIKWGVNFIRYVMIIVIIITILQLLGVYDFKTIFSYLL